MPLLATRMIKTILLAYCTAVFVQLSFSQVGFNTDNSAPDPSAGLDVKFADKGLLPPRITLAGLNAIANPANGLVVYCTDCGATSTGGLVYASAGAWYLVGSTCLTPLSPAAGTPVTTNIWIQWNWSAMANATGYRWNTVNNYQTATDLGLVTSYTQSGLTCNTPYSCFVWAYSACGVSAPLNLSASTGSCLPVCGTSYAVNHVAGPVAPVTKTTTYQLVTNVPGMPDKCWIASNLGATHQAAYVWDDTEASAGWYWQFNRKQGYKHDGSSRTPNTTWITSISENSDWLAANDPCSLELGAQWRIPTYTEWLNVSTAGFWSNWTGPFNSALKLHAAGLLYYTSGDILGRGMYTMIWTGTQEDDTQSRHLYFYYNYGGIWPNPKSYGFPVRCFY